MNNLKLVTTENFGSISCDFYRNMNDDILLTREHIATMKEQQLQAQKQISKKPFKNWTKKMIPKYKLFASFFEVSLKELYHNLYVEFQNIYPDIDLAQLQEDYCFENGLERCYTMEVIEHNKDLHTLFEHMVDDLLDRYKLKSDSNEEYTIRKTIFT